MKYSSYLRYKKRFCKLTVVFEANLLEMIILFNWQSKICRFIRDKLIRFTKISSGQQPQAETLFPDQWQRSMISAELTCKKNIACVFFYQIIDHIQIPLQSLSKNFRKFWNIKRLTFCHHNKFSKYFIDWNTHLWVFTFQAFFSVN